MYAEFKCWFNVIIVACMYGTCSRAKQHLTEQTSKSKLHTHTLAGQTKTHFNYFGK